MANLRILARNHAETASSITDSPSMLATLPVTNLGRPTERARTARTTALATQSSLLVHPSNRKANMMALTRHNLTTSATHQLLHYSDAGATVNIYDSTALAAFSTSGLDTDIDDYTERDFRGYKTFALYHGGLTTIRSTSIVWTDASNPDGYMEATKVFIGQYFQATYNPPWGGVELTPMDGNKRDRADDGTMIIDKRWRARRLVINLEFITDAELATLLAIARYLGTDRECFISLYPGVGGVKELYNQMACRLVDSPTFNPHQWGQHKNSMVFEET